MLKVSFYSFMLRSLGAGLGFLVSVILARLMSVEGFGQYYYIVAVIGVVTIPVQAGMPILVVRETAKYNSCNEWGKIAAIWQWAGANAIRLSLAVIMIALIPLSISNVDSDIRLTWLLALIAIPVSALCAIRAAQLRGLHKVLYGQFPEVVLRPLVFVFALLLVGQLKLPATPFLAMAIYLVSYLISYTVGAHVLRRSIPIGAHKANRDYSDKADWWSGLIPLTLLSSLGVVVQQVDIVSIGILGTAEQVGVYRAAMAISLLVAFGFSSVHAVVAPRFASCYRSGCLKDLQRMIVVSNRLNVLVAVPVFLFLLIFGHEVIKFLFGSDFVSGEKSLIILAFSQLINSAFGNVALLLNMTGNEKTTIKAMSIALLVNVALNFMLIPRMGIEGAALATLAGMLFWNIFLAVEVKRKLSVFPLAYFIRRTSV